MTDVDRLANIERRWHVSGRDGFGDPPDVDYWTEDEMQARTARDAGHRVDEYVLAAQLAGAVDLLREIGAMAGAKANGADARAMAKRAREFVASLDQSGR
jgi:hypothetical protein